MDTIDIEKGISKEMRGLSRVFSQLDHGSKVKVCRVVVKSESSIFHELNKAVNRRDIDEVGALANELAFVNRFRLDVCAEARKKRRFRPSA